MIKEIIIQTIKDRATITEEMKIRLKEMLKINKNQDFN
jgi:hypothetical protein